MNPSFSIMKHQRHKGDGTTRTLQEIYDIITKEPRLKETISDLRKTLEDEGLDAYKKKKEQIKLPLFTVSGVFKSGQRNSDGLDVHSGLVGLDFDEIPTDEKFNEMLGILKSDNHVVLCFASPRGLGIKTLSAITPIPKSRDEHRVTWQHVADYYETLLGMPSSSDTVVKDIPRLCYFSHDPNAYLNTDAVQIKWEMPEQKLEPVTPNTPVSENKRIDLNALNYISPYEYDDWFAVGVACKEEGLGYEVWENWSRSGSNFDERECSRTWESLRQPKENQITWGTVMYLAQNNGYIKGQTQQEKTKEGVPIIEKTDNWNAMQMARLFGNKLRYCGEYGKWLSYKNGKWEIDVTHEVDRCASSTVREMFVQASKIKEKDERNELAKYAIQCDSNSKIKAMIERGRPIMPIRSDHIDNHQNTRLMFNVKNGTLDLETMNLRPAKHLDYITKQANLVYEKTAKCSKWLEFLSQIMEGNDNLIKFIQCALGYSLTGDTSGQCFFFLHGTGSNGKTVLLETVLDMLGDYASPCDPDMLIQKRNEDHPTSIAELKGSRFVSTSELPQNSQLHESKVKRLTGTDRIHARFMRQDGFTFLPTHKIWMAANHKPKIIGTDKGIWRRVRLIPFTVEIPVEQQRPIFDMIADFRKEYSGILNWMLEGLQIWLKDGLVVPNEISEATDVYREEEDVLVEFFEEYCEESANAFCPSSDLINAYKDWCEERREQYPMGSRTFSNNIKSRGFVNGTATVDGKKVRGWEGLRLKSNLFDDDNIITDIHEPAKASISDEEFI